MLRIARAHENFRILGIGLEDRLLSVIVARGTKPMRWLTRCAVWLEGVCHNSRSNLLKRVAGALLLPPFIGYEFLFRLFFGLQRLLILRRNRRHLGLEVYNRSLKFNGDIVNLNLKMCVKKALGYAGYFRERVVDGGEANHKPIKDKNSTGSPQREMKIQYHQPDKHGSYTLHIGQCGGVWMTLIPAGRGTSSSVRKAPPRSWMRYDS